VQLPRWNIASRMLIDVVTFTRSEQGTFTTLSLVRPDAYLRQPEIPEETNPFAELMAEVEGGGQ